MAHKNPIIYWLRQDLRLADNQALMHAASLGAVIPVYIWDPKADILPGGAAKWWLQETLKELAKNFRKLKTELILRSGAPEKILRALVKETGAKTIVWCRAYEPSLRKQDDHLIKALEKSGLTIDIRNGFLLHEPEDIKNGSGKPYRVYTPFSKACRAKASTVAPLPAPKKLESVQGIKSERLEDWKLVPRTATWPTGLAKAWEVTEQAAHDHLHDFVHNRLCDYKIGRDYPEQDVTSRLSPYLHSGLISPRQAWHALIKAQHHHVDRGSNGERYLLELLWREFSWHLLFHFPAMPQQPLNERFKKFPWKGSAKTLRVWQQGMTGYPIVDAGMRQLWQTGWMHNRVRMITASFLIKHLLTDWRKGMDWFWDTLVDADLGNNTNNWQWVAGCGADASPYFRIFNPMLQGEKFDANGNYIRKFVPELAKLGDKYLHAPWLAPVDMLKKAGIELGKTYPLPIVDHQQAREQALAALKKTKRKA